MLYYHYLHALHKVKKCIIKIFIIIILKNSYLQLFEVPFRSHISRHDYIVCVINFDDSLLQGLILDRFYSCYWVIYNTNGKKYLLPQFSEEKFPNFKSGKNSKKIIVLLSKSWLKLFVNQFSLLHYLPTIGISFVLSSGQNLTIIRHVRGECNLEISENNKNQKKKKTSG